MNPKTKSFVLFLLSFSLVAFSQNQGRNWFFGNNVGLSFVGGTPIVTTGGALTNSLGCAAISGTNGNLLFYTDGVNIYTSTHTVMANGTGLHGVNASQPALIIKQPQSANIYYVFTVGGYSTSYGLKYSTVDMSLASGMGSVTAKNVVIDNNCRDKLTAGKHCNGDDVWVVSLNGTVNFNYVSALLTPTGISTISTGSINVATSLYMLGQMKLSPNSKKLGLVAFASQSPWQIGYFLRLLADFNNTNGVISMTNTSNYTLNYYSQHHNALLTANAYGCEFSSNSSYFYTVEAFNAIYRNNLCGSANSGAVYNQESTNTIDITPNNSKRQLQLAPNDKIYVAINGSNSIGAINNPNCIGSLSTYTSGGVSINTLNCQWGLPNFPGYYFEQKPTPNFSYSTNLSCLTASFSIEPICTATGYSITGYQWNFGDIGSGTNNISFLQNPVHAFNSAGAYTVSLIRYFLCNTNDTISQVIHISQPTISVSTSSLGCGLASASVQVINGIGPYVYSWSSNQQISSIASFTSSGIYSVTVIDAGSGGCSRNTTLNINVPNFSVAVINTPTLLCHSANNATVTTLVSGGSGAYSYSWTQNSSNNASITGIGAGNYTVFINDILHNCTVTKTFSINQANPLGLSITNNNAAVCENNHFTLTAYPSGGQGNYSYSWTPSNSNSFQIVNNLPVGNYVYTLQLFDANNCSVTRTINFVVSPNPSITVPNAYACPNATVTLTANGATTYTWLPGNINSNSISASGNSSMVYTVSGTNQAGCIDTKTIQFLGYPQIIHPTISVSNYSVCPNTNATLIATGANSYTWWPIGVVGNSIITSVINTINYTVVGSNSANCTDTRTLQLFVLPISIANPSNNSPVCEGQTVNFFSNQGNSYVWQGPNNFNSNLVNPQIINSQNFNAGTYTLVITNNFGCKDSALINLVINPKPNVTVSSNTTLNCIGQQIKLTASGASTYFWFNTSTNNPIWITTNSNLLINVTGHNTLTGCGSTATLMINVKECDLVGINENSNLQDLCKIYPNPNHGEFIVHTTEKSKFKLINNLGQVIAENELQIGENKFQYYYLPKGIYFVECTFNNRFIIQKIMVD